MGANVHRILQAWRNPTTTLTALNAAKDHRCAVVVTASYTLPEVGATLTLTYTIGHGGAMNVSMDMTATAASQQAEEVGLLRYGMVMELPRDMNRSHYYGRGPVENYADRKQSQFLGIYD